MGQIWVTGDTHGQPRRLGLEYFKEAKNMTKEDVVEILGDFGLVWDYTGKNLSEKFMADWTNSLPFTTVATLGNHENYDRIEKLPVEEHFGAPVYVLRPSVFLLQSGYVYNINGKKIWNFNGARSHDIKDGILDGNAPDLQEQIDNLELSGKHYFRIKGISWWEQEIEQNEEVYQRGIKSLEDNNWCVDFIWTHCAPTGTASLLGFYENDRLTKYLEKIHSKAKFTSWYFGHYHINKTALPHEYCLFDNIERIA